MADFRREEWRDDRAWKRRREDPLACHNCGERGHLAKDCPSTHGKEIKDKVLVKDKRIKPRVIGTGGGVIKGLEQELGCRLRVEDVVKDDPDQGFYVRISGPGLDEVCRAVTRLEKLVSEVEAEQRQQEERRAQYQQQLAEQIALREQQAAEAAALVGSPNAPPQANMGGQGMQQQFRPGGFVPQRPGFGGLGAPRPSGMTSLRREYDAAMNQKQGFVGGQGQGSFDYSGGDLSQGGNLTQAGNLGQGINPSQRANLNQGIDSNQGVLPGLNFQEATPNQGSIFSQGGAFNKGGNLNQGVNSTQYSQGGSSNQGGNFNPGVSSLAGGNLEENMEMSPDRKDAFSAGMPSLGGGSLQQTANFGVPNPSPGYLGGQVGSGQMNGVGLGGAGFGEVSGFREGGGSGAKTLDELETRNIAEYLELAKQQMFEEDEEINRHRQRMREIQDYFQLRLSTLRQKQSQQREEFLILESQQRPQQPQQQFQLVTRLEAGSLGAQQNLGTAQALGTSDQSALGNYAGVGSIEYGGTGNQGYGGDLGQSYGGEGVTSPLNYAGRSGMGMGKLQGQQYSGYS